MEDIEDAEEQDAEELFEHFSVVVDKGQAPLRVDKFLFNRLQGTSRNRIQMAAAADCILVDGKAVKSNYKVKPLEKISLVLPQEPKNFELIPEDIPLDIVYEDDDVILLNKPAGLVVHPGVGNYTGTLVNALIFYMQNLPSNIGGEMRPGLVHRLDKNTSGIMVIAKNERAMTRLAKEFFDRTAKRTYTALVWGDLKEEQGTITGNIGRSLKDRKVMDVFPEGDFGKHAVTHYKVLERFGYITMIECKLETGRTHQIRAHFKHIGHPLFNDETYGGNKILRGTTFTKYKQFVDNCFKILPRQALHATTLGFMQPTSNQPLMFSSELPDDMMQLIEKWRLYTAGNKLIN